MKVNKEQMRAMAEKSDSELWREICNIAKSHGISLPDTEPKKEDLEKVRRALLGVEKMSLSEATRLLNSYRKQR